MRMDWELGNMLEKHNFYLLSFCISSRGAQVALGNVVMDRLLEPLFFLLRLRTTELLS